MNQSYAVTGPTGQATYFVPYAYSLPTVGPDGVIPGQWTTPLDSSTTRYELLYHVTSDPSQWLKIGCRIWDVEHTGIVATEQHSGGVFSLRLLRERPDLIPSWWRPVEDFHTTLGTIHWMEPQGEPDPGWFVFDTWDAARDAATTIARLPNPVSGWDTLRKPVKSAAKHAASNAGRTSARNAAGNFVRLSVKEAVSTSLRESARVSPSSSAWDAVRDAAGAAADEAAFMAGVVAVKDLLDPRHVAIAEARWDVWRRGFLLAGEVNGVLYVARGIVE